MKRIWIILSSAIILLTSCESNILEPIENGSIFIQFNVSNEGIVLFEIENRVDEIVKSFDFGNLPTGSYVQGWDFTDNDGNMVVEGIYFIYVYVNGESIITGRQIFVFNYE